MKNSLLDLNNHLFEQIERLNDEDITAEQMEKEIKRSKALEGLSIQVVDTAALILRAATLAASDQTGSNIPRLLLGTKKDNRR